VRVWLAAVRVTVNEIVTIWVTTGTDVDCNRKIPEQFEAVMLSFMEEAVAERIEVIVLFELSHRVIFGGGGIVKVKSSPSSQ
jgi:hypothetical protein